MTRWVCTNCGQPGAELRKAGLDARYARGRCSCRPQEVDIVDATAFDRTRWEAQKDEQLAMLARQKWAKGTEPTKREAAAWAKLNPTKVKVAE